MRLETADWVVLSRAAAASKEPSWTIQYSASICLKVSIARPLHEEKRYFYISKNRFFCLFRLHKVVA